VPPAAPAEPPSFAVRVYSSNASGLGARRCFCRRAFGNVRSPLRDSCKAARWCGSAPRSADVGRVQLAPGAWGYVSFRLPPLELAPASGPGLDVTDERLAAGMDVDMTNRHGLGATIAYALKCQQPVLECGGKTASDLR
jgi:hypothetical protein